MLWISQPLEQLPHSIELEVVGQVGYVAKAFVVDPPEEKAQGGVVLG